VADDILLELPADRTATALADWVEAWMIVTRSSFVSEEDITRLLRSEGDDLEDVADPDFDDGDDESAGDDSRGADESARQVAELVISEITERERQAADSCQQQDVYPFRRDEDGVRREATEHAELYEFLLWLSISNTPFRKKTWGGAATRLFDWLGAAALRGFLGPGAKSLRFGWPARDGRPKPMIDALDWLANHMGRGRGDIPVNPSAKDGGVDVVAWRAFADSTQGALVVLGQCTVTQTLFQQKLADVKERMWAAYLQLGQPPMTAMIVPYQVKRLPEEQWALWHYAVGMIIDRGRIVELLCRLDPAEIEHRAQITAWARARRRELAA
jgi:hypothetical protein